MPKFGYLISMYPAISHTFILREIRHLRAQGLHIAVASINKPDRPLDKLDDDEREEAEHTFYIKQLNAVCGSIGFYFQLLCKSPLRLLHTLFLTCKLAGWDLKRLIKHAFYFAEAVIVGRWMLKEKITHLHVHFPNPAATVALLSCNLTDIPYSITVHGPDEFYDVTLYNLREKIEAAAFLICISDYACSQLMRISQPCQWKKFTVISLGVDTIRFAPPPTRPSTGPCKILCVGRLVPAKGQHILIAAVDSLIKSGRNVRLQLTGEGPDRESLEQDVHRRGLENIVTFSGAVNPQEVRALYKETDIFALASFAEGVPVVLMEAMAMELPCVTTQIAGIPELIDNESCGLLVPPSSIERLAEALARLVDDPGLRTVLGKNARKKIEEKYRLDSNIFALGNFFRSRE